MVFPAYAGVNPDGDYSESDSVSIPRVCGGEPMRLVHFQNYIKYSPRMRG